MIQWNDKREKSRHEKEKRNAETQRNGGLFALSPLISAEGRGSLTKHDEQTNIARIRQHIRCEP